ncbi:Basic helix-loop-helix DNA-binding superfamily protein [Tripterygium wilfordii]|uniref:Basic helix-loop-helix DNA-binding superfamily protein n=1 Tax=Tripterygium wilfordii TaxID=458696 RepID=A0A7J7CU74_TRIWF|nr:transcription factor bHLH106 [Tripterygium wilfordii]KAF5737631.1 Basic helix-loop-helix DNA-binding superfamily protein [Tripterygium wilfordii]
MPHTHMSRHTCVLSNKSTKTTTESPHSTFLTLFISQKSPFHITHSHPPPLTISIAGTMQPENTPEASQLYRFLAENGVIDVGFPPAMMQSFCSSSSFYYPSMENSVTTTDKETPHDRALAALRNHKEAEKRRRERINSHLDKLRTLLPCNSKTDKASLLAKVVQRVRELKQQTLEITELETVPSETDEITVLSCDYSSDGRLVFKASLCCEDRSDLLPELIEILKSLHLKTLRAETATLGGRIRNVLIVAADGDHTSVESIHFLKNALKSLLERSSSSERSKRRRLLDHKITI